MNKYLHNGIGETEVDTNLSVNNGNGKFLKKKLWLSSSLNHSSNVMNEKFTVIYSFLIIFCI
jgi:hypothetical protein